jgi:hypothetical protein
MSKEDLDWYWEKRRAITYDSSLSKKEAATMRLDLYRDLRRENQLGVEAVDGAMGLLLTRLSGGNPCRGTPEDARVIEENESLITGLTSIALMQEVSGHIYEFLERVNDIKRKRDE